jgi:hypothetical protein
MARTNKTQETSKKRKANGATETTAKCTKTSDNQATSGSTEPSATPAPAPVHSRRMTVMSEEEDAAVHGKDAVIHTISDGDESEAESSEVELSELYIMLYC